MGCLVDLEMTTMKLDPDFNDEPLYMFVGCRGAPGVGSMAHGDDFIKRTLFGAPEVEAEEGPESGAPGVGAEEESTEDKEIRAKVLKTLGTFRQGHLALTEKWRLQSLRGEKRNRFSGPGGGFQSFAAGNFVMGLSPERFGVEGALKIASRLKVSLGVVLLALHANPSTDPINGAFATVKGQLEAAAAAASPEAKLDALCKEHRNLDGYLGPNGDSTKAFQVSSFGGGLYALQKEGEGVKGVGLSRVNIHNRATEQFGPRGGRYFEVAGFPEKFCGSGSPDYTALHTFALEAIESCFLICLGGPTSGQVMFGSPATIGHWDASSGGESLGFLNIIFILCILWPPPQLS